MKKTILVTGGAGFIGSNTVELLCDEGHTVRVIDDLSFGYRDFVDKRATFFEANISNEKVLDEAMKGVDVVVHFAANSIIKFSLENPLSYIENNLLNGTKLLESMRRNGVKKIIFSSSASVYGQPKVVPVKEDAEKNPMQPYGASKLAFEAILQSYYHSFGIESVSLRYFNAYGPRDEQQPASRAVPMWIKEALAGEPIKIYWNGSQIRDYVFVKDIAAAHIAVMDLPGCHRFNIGSGTGTKMRDILDEIVRLTGSKGEIIDQGERAGDPAKLIADTSLIEKTVGWKPHVTLKEGLAITVDYYKKR